MSEKTTSAEIEDVLSSIRRLVSDELRVPEGQARPASPEKLILTPAQRVDHPAAVADETLAVDVTAGLLADAGQDRDAQDLNGEDRIGGDAPGQDGPVIGLAGRFAALRAVVADRRLASESERAAAARDGLAADGSASDVPEAGIWIEGEDDDWVEDWAEPETADFVSFPSPAVSEGAEVVLLSQRVRSDARPSADDPAAEAAVQDRAGQGADGTAGDPLGVLVLEHPVAVKAPPADLGHELYPESEPVTAEASLPSSMETPSEAEIEARIEAEIAAQIEAGIAADLAASAAALAPVAAARDASPDPGADREERTFSGFDEDQLRILVRGMIKSELQGELGERITRNIRKMLRAEITRALSAHGLS